MLDASVIAHAIGDTPWKGVIEVIYIYTCPFPTSVSCMLLQVILVDYELGDVAPG